MTRCLAWLISLLSTFKVCAAQEGSSDVQRDDAQIQKIVREVLTDPEYRHLLRTQVQKTAKDDRMPDWLRNLLEWLFGAKASQSNDTDPVSGLGDIVFYLVIAVLAVLFAVALFSILKRSAASRPEDSPLELDEEAINPSQPPGDQPTDAYERRALAAAQAGDYRSALRELVRGSMSWAERAGLIRYRLGLTNRDYIRAVWRFAPRRESLLLIVAEFEKVFYGRRVADATTFDVCLQAFRRSFSTEANDASVAC